MNRPPSSTGRLKTGMAGRPPGTATRLTTGMVPGSRVVGAGYGGGGATLSAQVNVEERPVTQQGLAGLKTGGIRHQRQVQDKTFYMGQLRSKLNELNAETNRLQREIGEREEENNSFLSYEKTAEKLANELKDLQGSLADYNTLVDKLTTDADVQDVQIDYEELRSQNDREAKSIESIFAEKKDKEDQIRALETELDQEKRMAENLVAGMKPEMRQHYLELKDLNEHLLHQLERGQQELDALTTKKETLEMEIASSQVKQEAVRLYDQLHELEVKRDQLIDETTSKGTPAEEKENLLKQVKEDNQEIASMERQTNEIREKLSNVVEETRQSDIDIEENQGERNQKYRELKKREETMNEFLEHFEEGKASEFGRLNNLEAEIVELLEHMSRNMARAGHLPTPKELQSMKQDLEFKAGEMKKSESTATGLASERERLNMDLQKVEQLESKINSELEALKTKIDTMSDEIEKYGDLEKLKEESTTKKDKLSEDKVILQKRKEAFKKLTQELSQHHDALKASLQENETYTQLGNLERKWQHHEQNNFVMKEFIATKTMECDYRPITQRVQNTLQEYNQFIQSQLSGQGMVP